MRIWSLHPKYLDAKGLIALWREALLAKHVLEGRTTGYVHHPQLIRFRRMPNPSQAIHHYLSEVYKEAERRNYKFDKEKFDRNFGPVTMTVTDGQLAYEMVHLLRKLAVRDRACYERWRAVAAIEPAPCFKVRPGKAEDWEIQK